MYDVFHFDFHSTNGTLATDSVGTISAQTATADSVWSGADFPLQPDESGRNEPAGSTEHRKHRFWSENVCNCSRKWRMLCQLLKLDRRYGMAHLSSLLAKRLENSAQRFIFSDVIRPWIAIRSGVMEPIESCRSKRSMSWATASSVS
jgi:hypothetical protein